MHATNKALDTTGMVHRCAAKDNFRFQSRYKNAHIFTRTWL